MMTMMMPMEEMKHEVGEKKKRLTLEQVKYLEASFETVNKLGPERKVAIAQQLGLHPRQVAVWYQNRRARCKNKQLEMDYMALRGKYNAMFLENQKLRAEVHMMKSILQGRQVNESEESNHVQYWTWRPTSQMSSDDDTRDLMEETSDGAKNPKIEFDERNKVNEMQSYQTSPTISTSDDTSTTKIADDEKWGHNLEFLMQDHGDDFQLLLLQGHVNIVNEAQQVQQLMIESEWRDDYGLHSDDTCYSNSY